MFKIIWDKETGGVRLQSHFTSDALTVSPRPVFFEELDMLGLDKLGWQYPQCQEPLLWACNKQYFYRGVLAFDVKGANIYDDPTVIFQEGQEKLNIIPVDVDEMLKRVNNEMFLLESEAVEFIRDKFAQYSSARKTVEKAVANQMDFEALAAKQEKRTKNKMAIVKQDCDSFDVMPLEVAQEQGKKIYQTTRVDKFLASFSGGKDSQVVLDLCTRAIPPESFEVIYSDTGYELPPSLALYDQIIEFAELKEFENRPFKQLSSGMKSRLAFSIASLVCPDILILDEVLSVGDGAFREKSERKMREIIAGGATTILVSHAISQVRDLCNKVLWLHKGYQIEFGEDVEGICDRYEEMLSGKRTIQIPV